MFERSECGGMAEWLMAVVLKTTVRESVPGVRILLPPPFRRRRNGMTNYEFSNDE